MPESRMPDAGGPALLADIGGTNARFALATHAGIEREQVLACADYASLEDAARAYLKDSGARPGSGAFAVASPITGDVIRMTNLPWQFSIDGVRRALDLQRLDVINDFTAVALSIPHLAAADHVQIGAGSAEPGTPIGIIGPGSGLGVSALIPSGSGWSALATEGGHVTLAAASDREAAVIALLRRSFGHVSAERLVSGPGLVTLYETLAALDGMAPVPGLEAAAISEAGVAGNDAHAVEALAMFCALLGTLAGNLALTLGARGGVYIAGGIVPRFIAYLRGSEFRARFTAKGRMGGYLQPVPTYVVTHPLPALVGLRARLANAAE
jgi:glucokinase